MVVVEMNTEGILRYFPDSLQRILVCGEVSTIVYTLLCYAIKLVKSQYIVVLFLLETRYILDMRRLGHCSKPSVGEY